MTTMTAKAHALAGTRARSHGYAPVNGLRLYYEVEGTGDPLVFIHPALGLAGLESFPALVERHMLITLDLQGHGRTADIPDRDLSIEQYARDVIGLLDHLGIPKADFFGESYGGNTAATIAVRYPDRVRRVATFSATFAPPSVAHNPEMVRFDEPPTPHSRDTQFQRESYKEVAPDPDYWPRLWEKTARIEWSGFSREELASIGAPMLIVVGDRDFVRVEHAVDAFRAIPGAELAVIPDAGHFTLYSEPERVIPIVQYFFEKPAGRRPVATAGMGYRPGETR